MAPLSSVPAIGRKDRRRRRIERELRALHAMRSHLQTGDLVWAVVTIPLLALLCFLVAAKLHWLGGSLALSLLGAAAAGAGIWWIGRRWFTLAALIVLALLVVLFEGDMQWDTGSGGGKQDRRRKLDRAIARREALLRGMDAGAGK